MKKMILLSCLMILFLIPSSVFAQGSVRIKCDRFTIDVPSSNIKCYQTDENIPVSEEASPEEIAQAQVANTAIFFSDFSSVSSIIQPQVTFYLIDDLGKTSFSLLDVSMNLSDVLYNASSEDLSYDTDEESYDETNEDYYEETDDNYDDDTEFVTIDTRDPFMPYQAAERTVNALTEILHFEGGSGIRTIASFDNELHASSGFSNVYYSFQGLSDDGLYYISAVLPLRSNSLDGKNAWEIDWETFSGDDFSPSLNQLDYYVRSIVIE